MSFLKVIEMPSPDTSLNWREDPDHAYKTATIAEKAVFLLDQSIILNYLCRLYGDEEKLPVLLKDYREHVIRWYVPSVKSEFYKRDADPVVKMSYQNIEVLLGLSNGKVDADLVQKVLSIHMPSIPHAVDASFYAPYVQFVERSADALRGTNDEAVNKLKSISVPVAVAIPSFSMNGRSIYVNYETLFPSYLLEYKALGKLAEDGICPSTIWAYWSGYNWRGIDFSGVMGVLAAQCLERDANAIPKGSNMFGLYSVYQTVVPQTNRIDQSNSLALLSETKHRRCVIKFLCHLRTVWGVKIDDVELMDKLILSSGMDDATTLHKFLMSKDTREISVEMYNVFMRSCFGTFSELDMVVNGSKSQRNLSGSLRNAKKTEEDDPDAQQDDDNPESRKKQKKAGNETAPGEESKTGDATTDEATQNDPNEGNQDSPAGGDNAADSNPGGNQPDAKPDEEFRNPDESSATDQRETDTHTQQKIPSVPKLDDKRGVKLSLSEGETTSSVLYRKELEAYIDSLLANPPSILSTQTIAAIKKLRAHWLHLLSVKDLHDILSAMVRLPKSITIKRG